MSTFAELRDGIRARDAAATEAIAARIAEELPPDRCLALAGDLGAGKTTFVQGLARAWGIQESVTSPSFNICQLHRGSRLLVHVDAYRLRSAEEWDELLLEDFLVSPWCLAVEWPERVRDRLPEPILWLDFAIEADGTRTIRLAGR